MAVSGPKRPSHRIGTFCLVRKVGLNQSAWERGRQHRRGTPSPFPRESDQMAPGVEGPMRASSLTMLDHSLSAWSTKETRQAQARVSRIANGTGSTIRLTMGVDTNLMQNLDPCMQERPPCGSGARLSVSTGRTNYRSPIRRMPSQQAESDRGTARDCLLGPSWISHKNSRSTCG